MSSSGVDPGWNMFAIVSAILFLKMFATSLLQAVARVRSRTFTLPEDARLFANARLAGSESPLVERLAKVWRNDLETIPIFLFLAIAYIETGCWPAGAAIYFPAFAGFRIAHTIAYLNRMQPARTIFYLAGSFICVALALHLILPSR